MKNNLMIGIFVILLLSLLVYGCTTIQVQPKPMEPKGIITAPKECGVNGSMVEAGKIYNFVSSDAECESYAINTEGERIGGCYTRTEERPNTLIGLCNQNQDCMLHLAESSCLLRGQKTTQELKCEAGGGSWRMFGDGCGDSCGEKPRLCTLALEEACDCGATECWNSTNCISDIFEPFATPQEACNVTNGTWNPDKLIGDGGCKTIIVDGAEAVKCTEPIRQAVCECLNPLTFGLQGCKEYGNANLNVMSIVGEWN